MKDLINIYKTSCEKVIERISFLTEQLNRLKKENASETDEIENITMRIRLLYKEKYDMLEIIKTLESYVERRTAYAKTSNC